MVAVAAAQQLGWGKVGTEENIRNFLAAALRVLEMHQQGYGAGGFVSARHQEDSNQFFTHPRQLLWDEVQPEDTFAVLNGGSRESGDADLGAIQLSSHIFKLSSSVNAIIVAHPPAVMALAAARTPLQFISAPSFQFYNRTGYLPADFRFSSS